MKKNKSDTIVDFLRSHPLISHHALELLCDIPQSTIYKAVSAKRNVPDIHIEKIITVLKPYGLRE